MSDLMNLSDTELAELQRAALIEGQARYIARVERSKRWGHLSLADLLVAAETDEDAALFNQDRLRQAEADRDARHAVWANVRHGGRS